MNKVMVFGVFDGFHEGHEHFLAQAKSLGDHLVVVVAQSHIVAHLKGHEPQLGLAQRFHHLEEVDHVDEVLIGDAELGVWEVVKQGKPDIIALGYDQTQLKESLQENMTKLGYTPEIKVLDAYEPNTYHSSLQI